MIPEFTEKEILFLLKFYYFIKNNSNIKIDIYPEWINEQISIENKIKDFETPKYLH